MFMKLIYLVSVTLVFSMVGASDGALIGHWELDETSGTTATDSSGRGHDGTYVNTPGLGVPDMFGTGMDAAGGYMKADLGDDLPNQAEERTIALWLNTPDVRGDRKFCGYGSETAGQGFTFCIENVNGEDGVRLRHWGGNMFYSGFIAGQWNHIAIRVPPGANIVNDNRFICMLCGEIVEPVYMSAQRIYPPDECPSCESDDRMDYEEYLKNEAVNPAEALRADY